MRSRAMGGGGGVYRPPTDLNATSPSSQVVGIGASLAAEPDVDRYDEAHDPYHIGPRLPAPPRRPVDPMEAELIRSGNMQGLTAYQGAHHLTQLPFQKENENPQLTSLKNIETHTKGTKEVLDKVLTASQ
jgi:hypothetical protein